ncbi:phage neck terminator protein [Domibacillus iocasae]|uniref:Phage neck terminator protein gp12-like domain-containing protein n=1 Tax=Domibacillus iocasae TaxID=1714016 RepID=A0A1E7DQ84_9BACI|nr:hypothetical protein [Domibacillus iocasae]OES45231.1 hypothetical protein BA724_04275 [Domibacillus iocasae]
MLTTAFKNLIALLEKHTGVTFVKADQEGAVQPPFPYVVYKITSPYIKERNAGFSSPYEEGGIQYDRFQGQHLFTVSFNAFADDQEAAMNYAFQVHRWFLFYGQEAVSEQNFAVVNVFNIENRTTHLIDHYEYKYGFDVQLRAAFEELKALDTFIESVEITNTGG